MHGLRFSVTSLKKKTRTSFSKSPGFEDHRWSSVIKDVWIVILGITGQCIAARSTQDD